jgi:3-methyl-2-oxobutanoate hydroxymethyltransferase
VLVLHDMLNITRGKLPRFVRNFAAEGGTVVDAVSRYVAAVKDGSFPDEQLHSY